MKTTALAVGLLAAGITHSASAAEGTDPARRPAPRSRLPHHDGEPRIQPDHQQSQRAICKQIRKDRQSRNQLLCGRASEPDELSGGRRRLELRRPDRQRPRLAQCDLHDEPRVGDHGDGHACEPEHLPDLRERASTRPTPAVDCTNEVSAPPCEINIDGIASIPAANGTVGKTIADQLDARHRSWKSYQESLPLVGADGVNTSDGFFTNNTDFSAIMPTLNPPLTSNDIVSLYAAKHNPFVYFKSIQDGHDADSSLMNTVPFDGHNGLFADLGGGPGSGVLVHRAQSVQRPAWPRERRAVLQLRPEQRRLAGRAEPCAHLTRAT